MKSKLINEKQPQISLISQIIVWGAIWKFCGLFFKKLKFWYD